MLQYLFHRACLRFLASLNLWFFNSSFLSFKSFKQSNLRSIESLSLITSHLIRVRLRALFAFSRSEMTRGKKFVSLENTDGIATETFKWTENSNSATCKRAGNWIQNYKSPVYKPKISTIRYVFLLTTFLPVFMNLMNVKLLSLNVYILSRNYITTYLIFSATSPIF